MSSQGTPTTAGRELAEGDRLGPYQIVRKLGSGGMADVYFAVHTSLQRPVAVKVLRPSLAEDASHLQRFLQEARAAASLVHPNIVQVYDVGEQGDSRYIAQEYVAGINLRQYLTQHGTLGVRQALSVLLQTLAALKKSSSCGIIHRDIKPENILLTSDGDVKVTDFGLARVLLDEDPQLTRAGTTLGTPMYMSPEQLQDGAVDVRSDLYSLGVTMFHVLAGKPPFTGETPLALAMQHVQATPPPLDSLREGLPPPLVEMVHRLLAKQPAERFADPDDVLQFLRESRSQGLAAHWPEQTVPLPGAEPVRNPSGPSPAALRLQVALQRARRSARQGWLRRAVMAGVMLLTFALGATAALQRPRPSLFGNSQNMFFGVPKQETVEKQYLYALLSPESRNPYLWEAVPHFFPPEASVRNRNYAGKAWLQIARQQMQHSEDTGRARDTLMRICNYQGMDDLVKGIAWLELAALARSADDNRQLEECLNKASEIRERLKSADDRRLLDENVPERLRESWNPTT
jgi:eukaryotic-like serine/threonine-protein kinase